jgi:hypothetical protein
MDCCVEQADEVRKCAAVTCVNWPYRMKSNAFRKQNLSAEARQALVDRTKIMNAARAAKNAR